MNHTFTSEDILLYIYNETTDTQTKAIEAALKTDALLKAKYNNLVEMIHSVDDFEINPSDTSVKIILEASAIAHSEEIC
jgi:hypothetical protein